MTINIHIIIVGLNYAIMFENKCNLCKNERMVIHTDLFTIEIYFQNLQYQGHMLLK